MSFDRREALGTVLAGGLALSTPARAASQALALDTAPGGSWRRGFDNQRIPDLGNGYFLNPLMSGDHPDPTILKDGSDYYMTF